MKNLIYSLICCLMFSLSARGEPPASVPSFHIGAGEAVSAQVRFYKTAAPELYILLNSDRSKALEAFVQQNTGRAAKIDVCGEALFDDVMPKDFATSELIFLVSPQQALNLARKVMQKAEAQAAHK